MTATDTPPISATALQASIDLRAAFGRLRRRLMAVPGDSDISPAQASVLMRIGKGDAATASALAAAEKVRPQSMATTLGALEQKGLIARTPDPRDGRRQIVELTEAGRASVEGARAAGTEWIARTLQEQFTEDERRQLSAAAALLTRLTEDE